MMRFVHAVTLILLCGVSFGQTRTENQGSARALKGKVYVLTVFVSSGRWTKEEKTGEYSKIYEAQEWLASQARRFNRTVSFEGGTYGLEEPLSLDDLPIGAATGNEPTDLVGRVLRKIGYASPLQFHDWVKANTSCDQALVLILSDQKGIGYAMNYIDGVDKETYFLEGCILYRYYPDGRPMASSSIAHEFLHLFGAWDLYETFQQPRDRADKAAELFPDDVMHRTSYDIGELEIGRLTAWLVGLTAATEPWFEWFRPK